MSETHRVDFEEFDVEVVVDNEGKVEVSFRHPDGEDHLGMDWDTFREVIDFVCVHGLKMSEPYVVEYAATTEGAREKAAA